MIPEDEWKYLYNDSKPRASGDDPVLIRELAITLG